MRRGKAARIAFVWVLAWVCVASATVWAARGPVGEAAGRTGPETAGIEARLKAEGFVNVREVDPTLAVELKYACDRNFMRQDVYGDLKSCFLRPEPAKMLKKANAELARLRPGYRLLLVDGLRPNHIQRRMWKIVKDTPMRPYVADPSRGSNHNYGCAVDITVVDERGERLDMGTPVDHFGILAQPREEERFLREGKLTRAQVDNRRLLRRVMTNAGFRQLPIEWWHFDAYDKSVVRARYSMVE